MDLRQQSKTDAPTMLSGWWLESTKLLEFNHIEQGRKKQDTQDRSHRIDG
jgi:hypothetical protein